ncbi:MAG: hypothetical protein WBV93_20780, partial [Anaerobacillus sp.]
ISGAEKTIQQVNYVIKHNIKTLLELLKGETGIFMYHLNKEREHIEGLSENRTDEDLEVKKFVNDMYYIWRINQSLLILGKELGSLKSREASNDEFTRESNPER